MYYDVMICLLLLKKNFAHFARIIAHCAIDNRVAANTFC